MATWCNSQSLLQSFDKSDMKETSSGRGGGDDASLEMLYTIEDAIDGMGFGLFQAAMLMYTGLAWMGDAMEMMLLAYLGPAIRCEWGINARQQGGLTSIVFFGMMVGAYVFGAVSDRLGRRKGFFIPAVFTFSFGLLSAFAPNYGILLLCRMMVGLGLGGVPVAFSLFMEFVPSQKRGFWLVMIELFWTAGSVMEAGLGWVVLPALGWRYLLAFSCIPLLLLLVLYPWLPESPHFLVVHDRVPEAQEILKSISKLNKMSLPNGKLGRKELSSSVEEGQTEKKGLTPKEALQQLFSPEMRRTTMLLWFIFASVAMTYYGMVQLATQLRAHQAECIDGEPELTSDDFRDIFITAVAELPGILLASGTVEWLGRRWSLITFLFSTAIFGLILSFMTALSDAVHSAAEVVLLFGARGAIMGGFTILYVYAPEVYPTNVRSSGVGLANAFARVGGLISPVIAVELVDAGAASAAEAIFALICVACSLATYALKIETKGRGLQETVESLN